MNLANIFVKHSTLFCIVALACLLLITPSTAFAKGDGEGGGGGIGGVLGSIGKGISSGISAVGGMFGGSKGDGGGGYSGDNGNRGGYESFPNPGYNKMIDLLPVTSKVNISESKTTFLGRINIQYVTQQNGVPSYNEGGGAADGGGYGGDGTGFGGGDTGGENGTGGSTGGGSPGNGNGDGVGDGTGSNAGGPDGSTGPGSGSGGDSGVGPGTDAGGSQGDYGGNVGMNLEDVRNTQEAAVSGSTITNQILIDYTCDDSIDEKKEFPVPNTTIYSSNSGSIPLSIAMETGTAGNHCFAFEVDTKNIVVEANEKNNMTKWHTFSVAGTTDLTIPTPGSNCPIYSPPLCEGNQTLTKGARLANGCYDAPYCSVTTPGTSVNCPVYAPMNCTDTQVLKMGEKLPNGCDGAPSCVPGPDYVDIGTTVDTDMSFEVRVFTEEPAAGGSPAVRVLKEDWTSNDISVDTDDILQFRWNASPDAQCLVDINPVKYTFDGSNTISSGNTETLEIEIHTRADAYTFTCKLDDIEIQKSIDVSLYSS